MSSVLLFQTHEGTEINLRIDLFLPRYYTASADLDIVGTIVFVYVMCNKWLLLLL